jgi:hypothetical protein
MQQALLRYYGNDTDSLLCNRHCYVTMETPNMSQHKVHKRIKVIAFWGVASFCLVEIDVSVSDHGD